MTASSVEAERSILGSVLLDNHVLDRVDGLAADDFHTPGHRLIFAAMLALAGARTPVDEVTVVDHLRSQLQLDAAGGMAVITELARRTPTSAHAVAYSRIVQDRSLRRRIVDVLSTCVEIAKRPEGDSLDVLERAQKAICDLTPSRSVGPESMATLIDSSFSRIQAVNDGTMPPGMKTGFAGYDGIMGKGGAQPGDMVVVSALTSAGKSIWTGNVVTNVSLRGDREPSVIFSMEMTKAQVMNRLLSAEASVLHDRLKDGGLTQDDWTRLAAVWPALKAAPIWIDDRGGLTVQEIRAASRRIKRERGLKVIVVDYLQQIKTKGRTENRTQEISANVRELKNIAKDLECVLFLVCQLNRDHSKRSGGDKRPTMSDLKESGEIEQAADVVFFLHHGADGSEGIVIKNRNGRRGTFPLRPQHQFMRFVDHSDLGDEVHTSKGYTDNPDERTAARGDE